MASGNYFTEGSGHNISAANPVGDDGTYVLALPPPTHTAALSQSPPMTLSVPSGVRDVVKMIVAIIVAFAMLWLLDRLLNPRTRVPTRNPVRRLSTSELAGMLRERIERRDDANPAVLRALSVYETRGGHQ